MGRPTKEQIEAAREIVRRMLNDGALSPMHRAFYDSEHDALEKLLAATAKPSEEELAEEALRWIDGIHAGGPPVTWISAYIAGARREGAR